MGSLFKRTTIKLVTVKGERDEEGFVRDGIALVKYRDANQMLIWSITHVATGRYMVNLPCKRPLAEHWANEIIKHARLVGCDLHQPSFDENHGEVLRAVCAAAAKDVAQKNALSPRSA